MPKIAGDINTARSYASASLTEAVEKGQEISKEMQDDYVSTEHLLLGLASVGKPATFKNFLKNFDINFQKLIPEKLGSVVFTYNPFVNLSECRIWRYH